MKDLSPLLIGVRVARIAIWDTLEDGGRGRTVKDILEGRSDASGAALAALVTKRAG